MWRPTSRGWRTCRSTPTCSRPIDQLKIQRPLLGYPAVVYTGKYADPITLLKNASQAMVGKEAFGIADPDVDRVEVTVEVETLRMDNLLSVSGTENYVAVVYHHPGLPGGQ